MSLLLYDVIILAPIRLQTKPFEPKLPLPESFESELMKTAISQLQPIVNQVFRSCKFLWNNFLKIVQE